MAVSTIDPNGLNVGQLGGTRNLIINGDMSVAQRGTSFTPSGGSYTVDRWSYDPSAGLSWYTFIQNGDSLTPPTGFSNYIAITSTGANTPSSTQFTVFRQPIEGLNTAQLGWGTADAKNITISFWVRSTLTGTFAGSLRNNGANYCYPFTYSISAANTWEKKTITVAGATSGTWLTTNGLGVLIGFNLGSGSNYAFTANTWTTSWAQTATGSVNISETNNAKLYLTGVQLEVGDTATDFEHELYATTLQKCQRYFWRKTRDGSANSYLSIGQGIGTTEVLAIVSYPVPMRAAPTFSASGSTHVAAHASSNFSPSGNFASNIGVDSSGLNITGSSGASDRCYRVFILSGSSNYIQFDAEI